MSRRLSDSLKSHESKSGGSLPGRYGLSGFNVAEVLAVQASSQLISSQRKTESSKDSSKSMNVCEAPGYSPSTIQAG